MITWLLAVIFVEAVTELILEAEILLWFRSLVARISSYLGVLFSCGFCLSFWMSMPIAWSLDGDIIGIFTIDAIIRTIILWRISNVWHELLSRWFHKHPFVLMVSLNKSDDNIIVEDEDE